MYKYIIFVFFLSCTFIKKNTNDQGNVLASVGSKVLLKEDIIYQKSMGDSLTIFTNQINNWLKKQLLLKSAYQTEELKSLIDRKVQSYRDDLVLFEFEKLIFTGSELKEITSLEIEKYYNQNIDDFILPYNLVKGLFIRIPIESPGLRSFISEFRKYPNVDTSEIKSYVYQFADKSFLEDSIWIKFDDFLIGSSMPNSIDLDEFSTRRNFYQTIDDKYIYLYKIMDKKLIGDYSPIDFEVDLINTILTNKRKQDLFDKLRDSIFTNSKEGIDYEIY